MRVIVREWAKRHGAPDGLTTAFIKQARQAKGLPRLTTHACMHADGTGTSKSAQHLLPRRQPARDNPLKPANAAVDLIRRQALRLDARAVQLQSEWTLDTPIADMAQMVPQRCTYGYCRAAMHHIYRSATM